MIIEHIVFWGMILCSLVGYQCVSQTLLTGTHMYSNGQWHITVILGARYVFKWCGQQKLGDAAVRSIVSCGWAWEHVSSNARRMCKLCECCIFPSSNNM